ncbi:hypothetical protein JTB14_022138 [Gonioctena quinquepunctata]|nr:hypothetical protein JTB14_022138 [Gonioctena quinquepunctata]
MLSTKVCTTVHTECIPGTITFWVQEYTMASLKTIWDCMFSPKLIKIYGNGPADRIYKPNALEKIGDQVIHSIYVLWKIGLYTSPVLIGILYQRGYFEHDGLTSLTKLVTSVGVILVFSFCLKGLSRSDNPTYCKFLETLQAAQKELTPLSKRQLNMYDFDFKAWPVEYKCTDSATRTRLTVKHSSHSLAQLVMQIPYRVIAYVAIHTFGIRLIYPGSMGILQMVLDQSLIQGRSRLVELYSGERFKIQTADNNSIDSMFINKRNASPHGNTLVICCEGNAGFYEIGIAITPLEAGYSVLGWNHPGFGGSTGRPYPPQEHNAVNAVIQFAMKHLGFKAENILLFGWSIGGYSASWAAMNYPEIKGVILDATFDDILPLAVNHMPSWWGPIVEMAIREHANLNVFEPLSKYPGPVLLFRRTDDEVIALREGDVSSNRGNHLLSKLLRYRYPCVFEELQTKILADYLAVSQGSQGTEYSEINQHMDYPVKSPYTEGDVELDFTVKVPPMGMKAFYVVKTGDKFTPVHKELQKGETKTLGTGRINIKLGSNGHRISVKVNEKEEQINQNFMYYVSNNGSGDGISSGAYVFRPINGSSAYPVQNTLLTPSKILYREGLQMEIMNKYNDWLSQIVRIVYDEEEYLEYDWLVGPLDNDTVDTELHQGREIVVRYSIKDMKSDYFYTDSNGRQMIQRQRNNNSYDDPTVEPVSSNYFPVTSKISIRDEDRNLQLSVLTDRAQGGTSLTDGEVELMIHRRTMKDDHKGVGQPLREMEYGNYIVTRGSHLFFLDSIKRDNATARSSTAIERIVALKKLVQPWVLIGDATSSEWSLEKFKEKLNFKWSGMNDGNEILPDNLNILNLAPWRTGTYLLRLEHIFEKNEDETLSADITVQLKYLFQPHLIKSIKETTLGANDWLPGTNITGYNYEIVLSPMQIRTFIVEME